LRRSTLHERLFKKSRLLTVTGVIAAAAALAGCNTDFASVTSERALRPLPSELAVAMEKKNMPKESPILVRIFKEESELEVWKQDTNGQFALLKTYPICRWSGELGPKIKEGDRQAPEGFYTITPGQMNPNSAYYLSFDLGYPNAFDRAYGRTGSQLMVHGDCSSRGCYSMTDEQISEIYALGRDAFFGGQKSFQVQAYPFRMTAKNMARHRNNPNVAFWKMLKTGNDHFEVSHLEPKVNVCEKHYVFDAEPPAGSTRQLTFSASGKCPAFEVPQEIASAVQEKERNDEIQTAELVRRGTPTVPVRMNVDGGMNPVFIAAVKRNQIGVAPQEALFVSTPPGTIPPTVRPPRIPELADAPIMAGMAPPPQSPEVAPPQMAIAEPAPALDQPATTKSGGLFGSLFSADKKTDSPIDRMARLVGLGGDDKAKTAAVAPVAKPKPQPVAKPTHVAAHGAIRPKPAEAEPIRTAEPAKPVPMPAAAPAPAPVRQPAPANTAMNGAAPMVPVGTFDNRWSGFR
jgi:murein L,D-transpeptidase YafK